MTDKYFSVCSRDPKYYKGAITEFIQDIFSYFQDVYKIQINPKKIFIALSSGWKNDKEYNLLD